MEPFKNLIERSWEKLTDGWRELLTRGGDALTQFGPNDKSTDATDPEFPQWSLLASETWETALSIVIRMEIPGVSEDDLTVEIHGNTLRIRGEKRTGVAQEDRHYHLMERAYGRFERSIPLPCGVDLDENEVSCRDGVLTVILRKIETLPPRALPVTK